MKFSLCTDILFPNEPAHKQLPRVKAAGYGAFEFWYSMDKDVDAIAHMAAQESLELAAFCTSPNNLADAAERDAFLAGLCTHITLAKRMNCRMLITTVGQRVAGISDEMQTQNIIAGLQAVVPLLAESGITLVVEPLNTLVDHKGYFLDRSDHAFAIIKAVGNVHVKLLFDIYHQQVTEGNLIANITKNIDLIGHFHIADVPGRHEPGTGEINWRNVFGAIAGSGYDGYIGLEYAPCGDADESARQTLLRISY